MRDNEAEEDELESMGNEEGYGLDEESEHHDSGAVSDKPDEDQDDKDREMPIAVRNSTISSLVCHTERHNHQP